jgi:hypothetical protein
MASSVLTSDRAVTFSVEVTRCYMHVTEVSEPSKIRIAVKLLSSFVMLVVRFVLVNFADHGCLVVLLKKSIVK